MEVAHSEPVAVGPFALRPPSRGAAVARVRRAGATGGLLLVLAAAVLLTVRAAAGPSLLVPAGARAFPGWLAGPLAGLGGGHGTPATLTVTLGALLAGWLLALAGARDLPVRALGAAALAAHVVFLLGPPLFSADVFGYIGFARLQVVHHLDPYRFGTGWAPHDPVHAYLRWRNARSPYGPLFTVSSRAVVPLGVAGGLWAFKLLACAASLAGVALVARLLGREGRDPRPAVVLMGLNPLVLAFAVGGGHNDPLVVLAWLAGVALVLTRRTAAGAGTFVVAAALKVTGGLVAPFALAGTRDRRAAAGGLAAAGAAVLALTLATVGRHSTAWLTASANAAGGVATHSVPMTVARAFGATRIAPDARLALVLAVAAVVAALLVRAWRGADWLACAGWATLAVLCGSTWLLPWYATWLTPLAALGESRRLRAATVALVVFLTLTRIPAAGL
ncbi:glycosyltransferase 87 family protein [Paraconexibacter antarcticus]|uniref:Glycosyltransferase 87 family protein n=1 Tax=Paraconexibacter antarcticus TaxID=2949664 RepID=A0ABY5DNX0_9ACTN|nr:glycosyltransferase 87 family protein [Paraconexibacter antarcticus]UTI63726.1 glycosyltransferase 87 family protein [Paraconexibacter antarcticus]